MGSYGELNREVYPSSDQLKHISLAMSIAGSAGVLIAGILLVSLLCAKAYKTLLQRLFLYTLSTLIVHDLSHVASIYHYFNNNRVLENKLCPVVGFIANWSSWCVSMFYLVMILCLLVMVCVQTRGTSLLCFRSSKFTKCVLEIGLIIGSLIGPALILWVPYYEHQYGNNNGYCWIASNSSATIRLFYGYLLYEISGVISVLAALGITITYCVYSAKMQHARRMIKHLLILLIAAILYIIEVNMLYFIDANLHTSYHLRIFLAIFATLSDFTFVIGYLLAFQFAKIHVLLKNVFRRAERKKKNIKTVHESKGYGTFNDSTRVTAPSSTYFIVQHTDGFVSC